MKSANERLFMGFFSAPVHRNELGDNRGDDRGSDHSALHLLLTLLKSHSAGSTIASLGLVAAALVGPLGASAWANSEPSAPSLAPSLTPASLQLAQVPSSQSAAANLLFVNPTTGSDGQADGSQRSPFRTLTRALQVAPPSTVIMLAPGTYSADSGETFPLQLKPGVTLQGDPAVQGRGILIRGGGPFLSPTFASQNVTLLGANQAAITGVTVTNPNPRGYGLWVESSSPIVSQNTFSGSNHDGISITGDSAPVITNNLFVQNGANGMTVYGTSRPQIQNNVFERTGFGINVAQNAAPMIVGNQIRQNRDGVVLQANSRAVLQGNVIENNERDGLVAIALALPNLGTDAAPGNNTFRSNGRHDINATAANQMIPAFGNQIASGRTAGQIVLSGSISPASVAPAVAAAPPVVASPPVAAAPQTVPQAVPQSAPQSAPATPRANAAPPPSSSGSFAALPRLQAAPLPVQVTEGAIATPLQPVAPRAAASMPVAASPPAISAQRPPAPAPTLAPATAAGSFPAPTGIASQSTAAPQFNLAVRSTPVLFDQTPASLPASSSAPPAAPASPSPAASATSAGFNAPIEIPVPPPASSASSASSGPAPATTVGRPATIAPAAPADPAAPALAVQAPVEIPVPPPASATPSRPIPSAPPAVAAAPSSRPPSANVLPVPSASVPIGNTGGMPTVAVSRDPLRQAAGSPPPVPSRALAMGLRYRVLVEADSESVQAQVRSLSPGAFRTYADGRVMMQAGAYQDRRLAETTAQMLSGNGFRVIVQTLE